MFASPPFQSGRRVLRRVMNRHRLTFATALSLVALPAIARAAESDWRFDLGGGARFGQIDGHVQTPTGGEPGTSSPNRPTFGELGIDNVTVIDVDAAVEWRREGLYLDLQFIRPSGDATLDTTLISQGVTFPAGTAVHADIQLDQYRLAYGHRFDLSPELTLTPMVGGMLFSFDYNLDAKGGGGPSASRSYSKAAPMVGAALDWRPQGGPFAFEFLGSINIPVADAIPRGYDVEARVRYDFLRARDRELSAYVGVGFQHLHYDDSNKQTLPNDINFDLGPLWTVGFELRY